MKYWGLSLVFVFGCSSTTTPSPDGGMPMPGPTTITTDKGAVEGGAIDNARSWLGIPYAAPPVGDLRWKPPAEAKPWTSTLQAKAYGHACPQIDLTTGKPAMENVEDCLFLNVWTPLATPAKPAPVMVFIHGGGFMAGSSGDPTYSGANLAAKGVVVVSMNYRLGVFGFLEHSLLAAEAGKPAAPPYGLLDQRAALQWVKKNIAAFGGDPGNVTIFGESAGGTSVCDQLAMSGSAGLFHRAIVESGPCGPIGTLTAQSALKQGDDFAKALNCTDLACMRAKSATEVAGALMVRPALFGSPGVLWGPAVDGVELTDYPNAVLAKGGGAKVPVMVGTNKDEGNLFTYFWKLAFNADITDQQLSDTLAIVFTPQQIQAILTQYPSSTYPTAPARTSAILTDGFFACPARQTARQMAAHGQAAFLYQFAYPFNPPLFPNLGTAHGFELPFVFSTTLGGKNIGDDERAMSDAIMGYWTRFALAGDPNGAGAPMWPKYDMATDSNITLDANSAANTGLKKTACDFWDTL